MTMLMKFAFFGMVVLAVPFQSHAIIFEDLDNSPSLVYRDLRYDMPEWPGPEHCVPGVMYKKDCNICECTQDIIGDCTRLDCDDDERHTRSVNQFLGPDPHNPMYGSETSSSVPKKQAFYNDLPNWPGVEKCIPGVLYKDRCNTCRCTEDHVPACTDMLCN